MVASIGPVGRQTRKMVSPHLGWGHLAEAPGDGGGRMHVWL